MLSKEDLSRIVKDEIEDLIKKGKEPYKFYYILLDGKMYPQGNYDKEVEEGKRSPNDIYAYVEVSTSTDFDAFLFFVNYIFSVSEIVNVYLRKSGFTIVNEHDELPEPNLKYYIDVGIKRGKDHKPEYLVVNVYDVDTLARIFHIPQLVQQRLGSQPKKITVDEFSDIWHAVAEKQPLLAGYTYYDAWYILHYYYVNHEEKYRGEANNIVLAYSQLFPSPYRVCYEWNNKIQLFLKIDCLKIELRRFSS